MRGPRPTAPSTRPAARWYQLVHKPPSTAAVGHVRLGTDLSCTVTSAVRCLRSLPTGLYDRRAPSAHSRRCARRPQEPWAAGCEKALGGARGFKLAGGFKLGEWQGAGCGGLLVELAIEDGRRFLENLLVDDHIVRRNQLPHLLLTSEVHRHLLVGDRLLEGLHWYIPQVHTQG